MQRDVNCKTNESRNTQEERKLLFFTVEKSSPSTFVVWLFDTIVTRLSVVSFGVHGVDLTRIFLGLSASQDARQFL